MHCLVSGTVDDRGRSYGAEPAFQSKGNRLFACRYSSLRTLEVVTIWASPSRDDFQTCSQRRFQHQSPLWDRCLGHGANLFHDAFYKVVEDLQLAVERPNELFIRLNSHDNLGNVAAVQRAAARTRCTEGGVKILRLTCPHPGRHSAHLRRL